MAFEPDLEGYLDRIAYQGPTAPNLANLNALILAHVSAIPFENVDILLGRPIAMDLARIEDKLIGQRRGGYCFEQNAYFMQVLRAFGYPVVPLAARVRLNRPRDEMPPRTHMFLRVELPDGSWLVDVGVGGLSPTAALRLMLDVRQETPHEARRICSEGEWQGLSLRAPSAKLYHQALLEGVWQDVYEFNLEGMPEIDRELGNWYTSAHPQSHFKSRLTVARATPTGRIALLNRRLTRRRNEGTSEAREVGSPDELNHVLAQEFGIVLEPGARLVCSGLEW
ncbi:MAG TPA: arylamine N-acetyltransferase [Polyangiaceae bacterium]|nr:arylamine N-acetyltransferase [Polyangiaceae bacterium]